MSTFNIGTRTVGEGCPAFIVAEVSANHKQDLNLALETICAAKEAGADAVKFQTYTPDTITIDCQNEYFQIKQGTIWDGRTLYELYKEAYTPWGWFEELSAKARSEGIIFFSTPFDKKAVEFLEMLDVPAYKVASYEITDVALIRCVAARGKPVLISTGIALQEDVEEAVNTCLSVGNKDIALLKCTSKYPAPLDEINLKGIELLKDRFDTVVGLSDHSKGIDVAIAAVALGAQIIEKHFIIDRRFGGPDSVFSLEPKELKALVESVRNVEMALGDYILNSPHKIKKAKEHARSIFVVEDIKAGEPFTAKKVRSIRPGYGLHPRYLKDILKKKAKCDIQRGTPMDWKFVE
ncbi:MAG: pseudaminic acid synthase [Candidatus Magnetoovum sp. WYHC-5]|nr:pseudaminic acid synthase [Candidatus Magnetoovum sp. WYHC-5]